MDTPLRFQLAKRFDPGLGRAERCPGTSWHVERHLSGPIRKYGIVHTSIEAPLDETTGQPMAIEFYAEITRLDGSPAGPGGTWIDGWRARPATYANIQ